MIFIFSIVFCVIGIALLVYGFAKFLNAPSISAFDKSLKRVITVQELGRIEGSISKLREVIIIADNIEEPRHELYDSVLKNFKNGVKYTFIISKDRYEKEKLAYAKVFESIANVIESNYNLNNLFSIHSLNFEWNDYPYVFYRFVDPDLNKQKVFAYMGTQIKEGIADAYELLPPTVSLKIFNLALKGAAIPGIDPVRKDEVYDAEPKIISMYRKVS